VLAEDKARFVEKGAALLAFPEEALLPRNVPGDTLEEGGTASREMQAVAPTSEESMTLVEELVTK